MLNMYIIAWFSNHDGQIFQYSTNASCPEDALHTVLEERGIMALRENVDNVASMINDYMSDDDFVSIAEVDVKQDDIAIEVNIVKVHGNVEEL